VRDACTTLIVRAQQDSRGAMGWDIYSSSGRNECRKIGGRFPFEKCALFIIRASPQRAAEQVQGRLLRHLPRSNVILLRSKGRSHLQIELVNDNRKSIFRLPPLLLTSSNEYETLSEVRKYRVLEFSFLARPFSPTIGRQVLQFLLLTHFISQ
jgi:hypothetical protein